MPLRFDSEQSFRAWLAGTKAGQAKKPKKPSKWRNVICYIDGIQFDSKAEGTRYLELRWLDAAGEIEDLRVHPKFQFDANGDFVYEADFCYFDRKRKRFVCEDVKNRVNALAPKFRKNCRLMEKHYGISVSVILR